MVCCESGELPLKLELLRYSHEIEYLRTPVQDSGGGKRPQIPHDAGKSIYRF